MSHQDLDAKIATLSRSVRGSLFDTERRDGQFWKGVWADIRDVGQEFRSLRYPTKHDRDAAWATFQEIVSCVKEQRDAHARHRQQKDESSGEVLREVLSTAQAAWPHEDGFADFLGMITGATIIAELMVGAIELLADVLTLGLLRTDEQDPRKAKLLACGAQMPWSLNQFAARFVRSVWDSAAMGMMLAEIGLPPATEIDRASLEEVLEDGTMGLDHYEILPDRLILYLWPKAGGAVFDFFLLPRTPMQAKTGASILYD